MFCYVYFFTDRGILSMTISWHVFLWKKKRKNLHDVNSFNNNWIVFHVRIWWFIWHCIWYMQSSKAICSSFFFCLEQYKPKSFQIFIAWKFQIYLIKCNNNKKCSINKTIDLYNMINFCCFKSPAWFYWTFFLSPTQKSDLKLTLNLENNLKSTGFFLTFLISDP